MDLSPSCEQNLAILTNNRHRDSEIPFAHPSVGDWTGPENIDTRFTVSINVNMRRLVIVGVYDKPHACRAQHRNHELS